MSSAHAVRVTVPLPLSQLSCIVHPPHTQLNVVALAVVTVLSVIVFHGEVALNVIAPVYVLIRPAYNVILPDIVIATDQAHVTFPLAGAAKVISLQSFVVASIVTV